MSDPFLAQLRQGPLVCDGAMGTMLYALAPEQVMNGRCFDELVLTNPALVQEVHSQYIRAGAQVIETNTFGANAIKLGAHGLGDRVREINRRAAKLAYEARDVVGLHAFVAGAVGPTGQLHIPVAEDHDPRMEALRAVFREQIIGLIEGGSDLIILETFSHLAEMRQALLAARELGTIPVVAQMTFSEEGQSLSGEHPAGAALALAALGADVIGVNCSIGPAGTLDAVEEMSEALRALSSAVGERPALSAQPNAGLPTRVENRFLYVSTPHYFADYARQFADVGVGLIGGCCGTTPAHISAMRAAIEERQPVGKSRARQGMVISDVRERATAEPITSHTEDAESSVFRTRFEAALAANTFAVSVELDPPKGLNPQKILEGAAYLKDIGVQFVNIADSPMARVRMSCLALARLLRDHLDLEAIVHFTTRDRNLMGIQSDLLGAHALGIHNVLALTGDPPHIGNYPNLTGVWNVDSVGLIRILRGMTEGHDAAGAALGMPAHFHIGAALNLNMVDEPINVARERMRRKLLDEQSDGTEALAEEPGSDHQHPHLTETELELHRLRHKLDAGAQYVMTQPIYDIAPLERFLDTFGPVSAPLILGVMPLHSSKHAEYLHNEVPGISIPDEVRARMREAGDRGREVGIELTLDVVKEARARGLIQGCYLAPSYGRYDLVGELARELLRTPSAV